MQKEWSQGPMLLAACCAGAVNVWNPVDGSGMHEEAGEAVTVRWSPNRKAVVFSGADGYVHTVANGQVYATSMEPFEGGISCLRFSFDGKQLFISSRAQVHVLDLKRQAVAKQFSDHAARIDTFCIDNKDDFLASSSTDGAVMLRALKQQQSPQQVVQLWSRDGVAKRALSIATHAGAILVAGASGNSACLMHVTSSVQQELLPAQHSGCVTGVALAGPATLFTCGEDGHALLWDLRSKQVGSSSGNLGAALTCLSVREDDMRVALGSADGSVHLVDFRMASHQPVGRFRASSPVLDLHWQPPSRTAAAAAAAATAAAATAAAATAAPPHPQPSSSAAAQSTVPTAPVQVPALAVAAAAPPGPLQAPATATLAAPASGAAALADSLASMQLAEAQRQQQQQQQQQKLLQDTTNQSDVAGRLRVDQHAKSPTRSAAPAASAVALTSAAALASAKARQAVAAQQQSAVAAGGALAMRARAGGEQGADTSGGAGDQDVRTYVDRAMAAVREDVRNLHIEVLRQNHMQQMELRQLVGKVLANQERLEANVSVLAANVEQLARQQRASALSLF